MAWKNRSARNRARQAYNIWWRQNHSGQRRSPQQNSGCATGFLLTLAAVVVLIWAL